MEKRVLKMYASLSLDKGNLNLDWEFKIEQDETNNRLIFEMMFPSKISSYYSLKFANISTPTTYNKMFLQDFEISKGESIILDNSEIKFLNVINCSNVKIMNSVITKSLVLLKCTNLEIENCDINQFHVPNTNQNIKVKNTIIKKPTEGSVVNYDHIE